MSMAKNRIRGGTGRDTTPVLKSLAPVKLTGLFADVIIGMHSDLEPTVVFSLSDQSYGVELVRVSDILRPREVRPLSWPDQEIVGLVDVRGRTVPIVDVRSKLSHGPASDEANPSARILVMETSNGEIGMLVDAVTEFAVIPESHIKRTPHRDLVKGTAQVDHRMITLIDPDNAVAA